MRLERTGGRALEKEISAGCPDAHLNQGMVSNPAAPFGGVEQSGFGRERGDQYLESGIYMTLKPVG
jgi:acyl-CoA reductase-like NAD-dependent aldehyde dehydrogenase